VIYPLIIGAVLAACALAFVLTPLLVGSAPGPRSTPGADQQGSRNGSPTGGAATEQVSAVDALREIEFDRATGKLSEADYGSLKSAYTARALAELRESATRSPERARPAVESDTATVSTPAACPACQAHTVANAAYCIQCGHYLAERCPGCGTAVTMAAARYCGSCGSTLAAIASS
jgi:hypothetical protein